MFPSWALYLIIGVCSAIFVGCLTICFCFVRRIYNRKKNVSQVKKYVDQSTEDKLKKYRYNKGKIDMSYYNNEGNAANKPFDYQSFNQTGTPDLLE